MYVPVVGDEWVGQYTCKGQNQLYLRITAAAPTSSWTTGGRLAYAFTAIMALSFQPVKGPDRSFYTWFPVKGRYVAGANTFEWTMSEVSKQDNRLHYFSGMVGADGNTVVGVIPPCGSSTFTMQYLDRRPEASTRQEIILPVGCFEIGCLPHCKEITGPLLTVECLEELWVMSGCEMDGSYAPRTAPSKQVKWWKEQTPKVTLGDMQWYRKYAQIQKKGYRNMCFDESTRVLPAQSGSIRKSLSSRLEQALPYHMLKDLQHPNLNMLTMDSKNAVCTPMFHALFHLLPLRVHHGVRTFLWFCLLACSTQGQGHALSLSRSTK